MPIVLASQVVMALQSLISRDIDPTDPALLTIGKIEGGTKADLIADRVHLEGIVRTLSDANRKKIPRLMESAVKGIVHSFGGDYAFSFEEDTPAVYNHPELFDLMMPSLIEALGEKNVSPIKPQMMADDFALYSQKIPALYFLLGVKNPRLPTRRRSTAPISTPMSGASASASKSSAIFFWTAWSSRAALKRALHNHMIRASWPFPFLFLALSFAVGIWLSDLAPFPLAPGSVGLAAVARPRLDPLSPSKRTGAAFGLVLVATMFLGRGVFTAFDGRFERNALHRLAETSYADFTGVLYRSPSPGLDRDYLYLRVEKVSAETGGTCLGKPPDLRSSFDRIRRPSGFLAGRPSESLGPDRPAAGIPEFRRAVLPHVPQDPASP